MKFFSFLSFVSLFLIVGCSSDNSIIEDETPIHSQEHYAQGKELLETKCFACHNPTTALGSRMAPPMIALKDHYKEAYTDRKEFIEKFVEFAATPKQENVVMKNAAKKFNIMPDMGYEKKELELIAEYLYDNKVDEPKWYAEHKLNHKDGDVMVEDDDLAKGLKLALSTKKILGKNLMGQINKNGSAAALSFCNEKAYHLVDSMSTVLGASIKRVSDKPRNMVAQANEDELAFINKLQKAVANSETPKPISKIVGDKTIGYYPIMTNQMCMQCHGNPGKDIDEETRLKITNLYPEDKAIGYSPNQVRGIWVVEMENAE